MGKTRFYRTRSEIFVIVCDSGEAVIISSHFSRAQNCLFASLISLHLLRMKRECKQMNKKKNFKKKRKKKTVQIMFNWNSSVDDKLHKIFTDIIRKGIRLQVTSAANHTASN